MTVKYAIITPIAAVKPNCCMEEILEVRSDANPAAVVSEVNRVAHPISLIAIFIEADLVEPVFNSSRYLEEMWTTSEVPTINIKMG